MNTLCILNPTTSVKWVSRTYYLLITPFCLLPTIEYHTHHSCGYSSDSCSNSSCSTTPNCTIFTKFYQDDCRPGDRTKAKPSGNPGRRPVVYTQTNSSIVMKNEAEPRKEEWIAICNVLWCYINVSLRPERIRPFILRLKGYKLLTWCCNKTHINTSVPFIDQDLIFTLQNDTKSPCRDAPNNVTMSQTLWWPMSKVTTNF